MELLARRPGEGDRNCARPHHSGPDARSNRIAGLGTAPKDQDEPPTEEIPVIVCTAATNWVREQEGWLAANAIKVVLKPFKVGHLEHAIRQALDLPEVTASPNLAESETPDDGVAPPPTRNGGPSASKSH